MAVTGARVITLGRVVLITAQIDLPAMMRLRGLGVQAFPGDDYFIFLPQAGNSAEMQTGSVWTTLYRLGIVAEEQMPSPVNGDPRKMLD